LAELNRILSENLAIVVGTIGALLAIVLILLVVQSIRLSRAARRYRRLVGDGSGGTLANVLEEHVGRVDAVGDQLEHLRVLQDLLERRSRGSIQHVGLVRFNPFDDTGSDQSFALALLDERRDGVVISSLHGRNNTRLFAKPVSGGESAHTLSDEELQAIRIAVDGTEATQLA
jgi:uncharacterized protein DUF4446